MRLLPDRFRCLVSSRTLLSADEAEAIRRLQALLTAQGLIWKVRERDGERRLMVARRHFNAAFRVLVEAAAKSSPGFVSKQDQATLHSPANG